MFYVFRALIAKIDHPSANVLGRVLVVLYYEWYNIIRALATHVNKKNLYTFYTDTFQIVDMVCLYICTVIPTFPCPGDCKATVLVLVLEYAELVT